MIQRNLVDVAAYFFGLQSGLWRQKWLVVDSPKAVARFVFARSARYHRDGFPWQRLVAKHGVDAIFVGLPQEYDQFVAECGHVSYIPTDNLLDVARLLAGAEWVVANQSAPLSIAEGLGLNVLLEQFDPAANCNFDRQGQTTDPVHVLDLC